MIKNYIHTYRENYKINNKAHEVWCKNPGNYGWKANRNFRTILHIFKVWNDFRIKIFFKLYFLPKWPMDLLVITISNAPQYLCVPGIGLGLYNSSPREVTLLCSCSWACEGLGQDFSSILQGLWLEALTRGFRGCSKPALLSWSPLPLSLP